VFSLSNVDIRVVDRDNSYSLLVKTDKLKHFSTDRDGLSNRYFYSIPVQTPSGDYVGFIYRALFGHDYASIYRPFENKVKRVPYMFGFFNDFQNYDRHTSCMPIVVCEGVKDAIVLKKFYPYVLSNNTSALRLNANVISNITDKVILAYDNDETGKKEAPKDKKKLAMLGCSVDILKYDDCKDDGLKDAGEYINHPKKLKQLRTQLKLRIKGLINGVTLAV
jgi:5S rRNA maturation endonuclease (ribonuclease M5)